MDKEALKNMRELDEIADREGGFLSAVKSEDIHYDYRAIDKYCKEKGIEPLDMTIRELNQFVIA